MNIVLAGFGNMGRALVSGWIDSPALSPSITVYDVQPSARERAAALGLNAVVPGGDSRDVGGDGGPEADVVVIAVKPAEVETALAVLPRARLYLSIAAGRTIAQIEQSVGRDAAVVRAMPNTPAAIGLGATGMCANENVSPADHRLATELMEAVGVVEWLDKESDLDAVTALSGSGPAYVFLLIESLTRAAIAAGLTSETAERLAAATVHGAGAYAATADVDASTLRHRVTSPNGTTAAALEVLLADDALGSLICRAVDAAAKRSRELGAEGSN